MLNLLNESDIKDYFKDKDPTYIDEAISALKIFNYLGISPEILDFDDSGFITLNEHGIQRKISIFQVLDFSKKLSALKNCEGFDTLSDSINNEAQFSDTMFEIECIYDSFVNPNVLEVKISPEITCNGSTKRPDFSFLTKNGNWVICECKSIASTHRIKNSMVFRFIQRLNPYLNDIPDDYRVEIAFKCLPPSWNSNLSQQISDCIKTLVEKRFTAEQLTLRINEEYEVYIKLCFKHESPYFNCLITAANRAQHENPSLIIGEFSNIQKSIKYVIRDGLTQLPDNNPSLIYLESLNEYHAKSSIERFFSNNVNLNLCGIFSWTTHSQYHANPKSIFSLNNL